MNLTSDSFKFTLSITEVMITRILYPNHFKVECVPKYLQIEANKIDLKCEKLLNDRKFISFDFRQFHPVVNCWAQFHQRSTYSFYAHRS